MLASLLMYHYDVANKYSLQHVLVQRLVTVAVTLGKSHVHLCQWGQHIKEEYVRANASNLDRSGNINIRTERELRQVRDENSHLRHKVDNLHGTVEALQTTIQGMLETQKQCLYLLQNQCASQPSSPVGIVGTNKKRRIDSDSSEPPAVEMPAQRMRSAFDLMNASVNRIPNVERTASEALKMSVSALNLKDPKLFGGNCNKQARNKTRFVYNEAMALVTVEEKEFVRSADLQRVRHLASESQGDI